MQRQTKDVLYEEISRHNPVTMTVRSGEVFEVETCMNTGTWLNSPEDYFVPGKGNASNPVSGNIFVEDAHPGDMLRIRILDIKLNKLGYTGWDTTETPFTDWLRDKGWGCVSKTVQIEDGYILWGNGVKIPVQPMVGIMATAPARGCPSTVDLGPTGGNMDVQEVTVGNDLYLPVEVEGACLMVGDVHARQGDGEVCCGGGLETSSVLTLQVEVLPRFAKMTFPRIENEEWIAAIGIAKPMEDATKLAVKELVNWMVADYGFTQTDAILLLGQVLEMRCTQIVDPKYTVIAKIRKEYLVPVNDGHVTVTE